MKRKTVAWVAWVAVASGMALLTNSGCANHDPAEGTGHLVPVISGPLSVEDTPVTVGAADAGVAGPAKVCGVTLVAALVFHGSNRIDGTASLTQPLPFAIPAAIPITSGGTKNGHADLQFSVGGGAPVTCSFDLQGGGQSFPLSSCDDGAVAGTIVSADSFTLHIQSADHGAGASGTEIQLTTELEAPDGMACIGNSKCFNAYACVSGTCTGSNPVLCAPSDQCHAVGICDPSSGACSNPSAPNGAACNDGNACTQTDSCQGGTCTGANPVTCTASDACHLAGTCAPTSGACSNPPVACSQPDVCLAGACTEGCNIDGAFYAPGTANPNNACQTCNPGVSTSTWDGSTTGCCMGDDVIIPGKPAQNCSPYTCATSTTTTETFPFFETVETAACTTTCIPGPNGSGCGAGSACGAVEEVNGSVGTFCSPCGEPGEPACTSGAPCNADCGLPGECVDNGLFCIPCGDKVNDFCCDTTNAQGQTVAFCNAGLTCNGTSCQ
jgi:hypothetical protein